jgi:hypothetical protein
MANDLSLTSTFGLILGDVGTGDMAAAITAFKSGNVVAEIQACATIVEATEKIVAIFVPGVAIAEVPTALLAMAAILAVEFGGGKFTLGDLDHNAGEQQSEIAADRFGR